MEVKRIEGFVGEIPRLDRGLLPPSAAQEAANVFLTSGRLDPMKAPRSVQNLTLSGQNTIYRMFKDDTSYWLSWKEQVDVAESPVFVENNFRIAFTSPDFEPRQTDLTLANDSLDPNNLPGKWYVLGVTPPTDIPVVTSVTGGSGTNVSRTYVYTFANSWGEESAPSPTSVVFSGLPDGVWNLNIPSVAPPNTYSITDAVWSAGKLRLTLTSLFGLRAKEKITLSGLLTAINTSWRVESLDTVNLYAYITMSNPGTLTSTTGTATRDAPHNTVGMTKRVYRSVTNAEGTAFYLVGADIPVATTTFADSTVIIGEVLETLEWAMPPADLEGLVVHPSGCMVGFRDNEVYISEPYAPYAYKQSNVQVLDFPAVGMGVFGQSVIIGTKGKPYLISFVSPETATPQKIDQNWPCLSKRGVIGFNGGVYYPTSVGLAFVGVDGAVLVTEKFYAQRDWSKQHPETFIAGYYDNRYYAVRTIEGVSTILIVSDKDGVSTLNTPATALFSDRENGELFICNGNVIEQLNSDGSQAVEFSWTSKEFTTPEPVNLGAAKIDFDLNISSTDVEAIEAANEAILIANALLLDTLVGLPGYSEVGIFEVNYQGLTSPTSILSAYFVTFTLLVNNELYYQKRIVSGDVFRLPAGKKYDRYAIRLSGTAPVTSVVIGDTPWSLKQV
jgi:hypothetical protein